MQLKKKAITAKKKAPLKAKANVKAKAKAKAKPLAGRKRAVRLMKPTARRGSKPVHAEMCKSTTRSQSDGERRAVIAAEAAYDKKANDVMVLDLTGLSPVMDHVVLASARSETHLRSVADNVEEQLAKLGQKALHREGYRDGRWIVLDYGDLMIHIFMDEQRSHYRLEELWSRARVVARYEA
jgi:ribosome-associated protein